MNFGGSALSAALPLDPVFCFLNRRVSSSERFDELLNRVNARAVTRSMKARVLA